MPIKKIATTMDNLWWQQFELDGKLINATFNIRRDHAKNGVLMDTEELFRDEMLSAQVPAPVVAAFWKLVDIQKLLAKRGTQWTDPRAFGTMRISVDEYFTLYASGAFDRGKCNLQQYRKLAYRDE